MENNINVLLFLSHEQQPLPDKEMRKLAEIYKRNKEIFFATTRDISVLSKGAEVAFYAADKGHYSVLATAKFVKFISCDDKDYKSLLSRHQLYADPSDRPSRMVGLVQLIDFDHFPSGKPLECLNARLDNGRALKEEEISPDQGPDSAVCYIKAPSDVDISPDDRIRLLDANKQIYRTKIMTDRESGDVRVVIDRELDGSVKGFGDRFWKTIASKHEGARKVLGSAVNKVTEIKYSDRYLFTPLTVALLLEVVLGLRKSVGQDRWVNPICRVITMRPRPTNENRRSELIYSNWPNSNSRDEVLKGAFNYFGMKAEIRISDYREADHPRILEVVFSDGWNLTVYLDGGVSYWRVPDERRLNSSFDFGEALERQIKHVVALSVPVRGKSNQTVIFVGARSGNTGRA